MVIQFLGQGPRALNSNADDLVGLPKYGRIASHLRDQIVKGVLAEGEQLPSEADLARQFGVSRMTVRQAHDVLERGGFIRRTQGRGTVVASRELRRSTQELTGLSEDIRAAGRTPGARVLSFAVVPAQPAIAGALQLRTGEEVVEFELVRTADDLVIGVQHTWMPRKYLPDLTAADLEEVFLVSMLERRYGLRVKQTEQELRALTASPSEAAILGVSPGAPVFAVRRLTLLDDGRPIELLNALYLGDRVTYASTLFRHHHDAAVP
ncbi:MAG: GntR family transcriptional regulator [Planctomycetes bacterium]|nr:GntR family transcriptional regulator [Planctomycetota bacterium]